MRIDYQNFRTRSPLANVSNVLMNLNEKEVSLEQELTVDMDNEKVRMVLLYIQKQRTNVVKEWCR